VRAQAPTRVVASDLTRARETAALLGWPDATADPRWREVDIGRWTGRLAMEVVTEEGETFRAWREGRQPAPGGEAYADMEARVAAAGRELLDGDGGTALVVCHGGPIRVLCVALLGLELRRLGGVGNGSATVLERHDGGARLAAYNVSGAGGEVL